MLDIIRHEPVIVRAVVVAALTLAISFGLSITDTQLDNIEAFVVAALILAGAASARQKVTPVE